jgi:prepilin-type processing-associated H-X9-DG protein
MYTQDYRDTMLGYWDDSYLWVEKIMSYVGDSQAFLCPSSGAGWCCTAGASVHPPESSAGARGVATGYAFNCWYSGYGVPAGMRSGAIGFCYSTGLGNIILPSQTVMLGDGVCPRHWGQPYIDSVNAVATGYCKHNGGNNFAYADGHGLWVNKLKNCWWDYGRSSDW